MYLSLPGGSVGKGLHAILETWVQTLGQKDPLEKAVATHSSILAWRISWTEETGRLQSNFAVCNSSNEKQILFIYDLCLFKKVFIDFVTILLLFLCFGFFVSKAL